MHVKVHAWLDQPSSELATYLLVFCQAGLIPSKVEMLNFGRLFVQKSHLVQVFAGSKQKELETGSMALMAGYTPIASMMLIILVPIFEPIGIQIPGPDTLIGFPYSLKVASGTLTSSSSFVPQNCLQKEHLHSSQDPQPVFSPDRNLVGTMLTNP